MQDFVAKLPFCRQEETTVAGPWAAQSRPESSCAETFSSIVKKVRCTRPDFLNLHSKFISPCGGYRAKDSLEDRNP